MRCADQSDRGIATSLPPDLHVFFHLRYTFDLSRSGGSASSHAAVGITLKVISVHKPQYDLQVDTTEGEVVMLS